MYAVQQRPERAEETFGEAAEKRNIQEVIYSFEGHKLSRDKNTVILSQEELERGDISMELASRMLNRTYYETDKIRKVLQTIFHMVNGGHQVFVIGAIQEDGSVKGGTGWAVEHGQDVQPPAACLRPTDQTVVHLEKCLESRLAKDRIRHLRRFRHPLPERRRTQRYRTAVHRLPSGRDKQNR
jgi:hypothetical protein